MINSQFVNLETDTSRVLIKCQILILLTNSHLVCRRAKKCFGITNKKHIHPTFLLKTNLESFCNLGIVYFPIPMSQIDRELINDVVSYANWWIQLWKMTLQFKTCFEYSNEVPKIFFQAKFILVHHNFCYWRKLDGCSTLNSWENSFVYILVKKFWWGSLCLKITQKCLI